MNNLSKLSMLPALFLLSGAIGAQAPSVRPSQKASVTQQIADTTITVNYSRPVAKGRILFGPDGIVKYDKIWMPGANEASFIKSNKDITINGKLLKAGSYSLWTIPGLRKWTVIFNSDWDQWHTSYPGKDKDAARIEVAAGEECHMETLAFYFPVVGADSGILRLHWGKTVIPLEIKLVE